MRRIMMFPAAALLTLSLAACEPPPQEKATTNAGTTEQGSTDQTVTEAGSTDQTVTEPGSTDQSPPEQ